MTTLVIFTRFISAFLTLCVLATTGMTANLRIDHGTGQFVTICADGQSVTVELDHTGAPLDRRHHCPDCIALVVLSSQQTTLVPYLVEIRLTETMLALPQRTANTPKPAARAPPLTV